MSLGSKALAVAISSWVAMAGCSAPRDGRASRPDADDLASTAALVALVPGPGSIAGEVLLSGPVPTRPPQKRGADPICAKESALDEQVLSSQGKLQNVLVRVVGKSSSPPPSTPVVVDQRRCNFLPRVQGAVVGQPIEIRNGDATLHNVHAYAGSATLFNDVEPPRSPPKVLSAAHPGIIRLKCDVHPWMTAYVVVSSSPYFSATGPDGSFSIGALADGSYVVEAWHEKLGTQTTSVEIRQGAASKVTFSYSPEDRG